MRLIILAIILAASTASAQWVDVDTGKTWGARPLVITTDQGAVYNPDDATLSAENIMPYTPAIVPDGHTVVSVSYSVSNGTATEIAVTEPLPEPQPVQFPLGIETPVTVLTDDAGVSWGVIVDDGSLITYQDHASPRPSPEVLAQRRADAKQVRKDNIEALRTIRAEMTNNIENAKAVTVTSTSTTAQVRSAVIDLRRELIDANRQIKELTAQLLKMTRDTQ